MLYSENPLLPRPVLFEYYQNEPTIKQHTALILRNIREIFYGGAAGGGKSEWLLQDALQYVDIPGYSALIIRKSYTDLAMPGALIDRSHKVLGNNPKVKWNGDLKRWLFPSGATISFGHLSHDRDLEKFQGSELQFIGFDEAAQLMPNQLLYLFSRLRRNDALKALGLPLRMRMASNPGGPSHQFLKARYVDNVLPMIDEDGGRIFIPSGIRDNKHIDREEYEQGLMQLDPVTRKRLLNGDWSIVAVTGVFSREWFPVISWFELPQIDVVVRGWDLAATAPNQSNRDPDYTATVKLGMNLASRSVYVLDMQRWRKTPAESEAMMRQIAEADGRQVVHYIELEPGSAGKSMLSHLQRSAFFGYPVQGIKPMGSKLNRAGPVSAAAQNGLMFCADLNDKALDDFFGEIELFPTKGVHDDFVDALSTAFNQLNRPRALLMA